MRFSFLFQCVPFWPVSFPSKDLTIKVGEEISPSFHFQPDVTVLLRMNGKVGDVLRRKIENKQIHRAGNEGPFSLVLVSCQSMLLLTRRLQAFLASCAQATKLFKSKCTPRKESIRYMSMLFVTGVNYIVYKIVQERNTISVLFCWCRC